MFLSLVIILIIPFNEAEKGNNLNKVQKYGGVAEFFGTFFYNLLSLYKRPTTTAKINEKEIKIASFTDAIIGWLVVPGSNITDLLSCFVQFVLSSLVLLLPMAILFVCSLILCLGWALCTLVSPKEQITDESDVWCHRCRTPNEKKWVIFCHICYAICALFMIAGCIIGLLGSVFLNLGLQHTFKNATSTITTFERYISELEVVNNATISFLKFMAGISDYADDNLCSGLSKSLTAHLGVYEKGKFMYETLKRRSYGSLKSSSNDDRKVIEGILRASKQGESNVLEDLDYFCTLFYDTPVSAKGISDLQAYIDNLKGYLSSSTYFSDVVDKAFNAVQEQFDETNNVTDLSKITDFDSNDIEQINIALKKPDWLGSIGNSSSTISDAITEAEDVLEQIKVVYKLRNLVSNGTDTNATKTCADVDAVYCKEECKAITTAPNMNYQYNRCPKGDSNLVCVELDSLDDALSNHTYANALYEDSFEGIKDDEELFVKNINEGIVELIDVKFRTTIACYKTTIDVLDEGTEVMDGIFFDVSYTLTRASRYMEYVKSLISTYDTMYSKYGDIICNVVLVIFILTIALVFATMVCTFCLKFGKGTVIQRDKAMTQDSRWKKTLKTLRGDKKYTDDSGCCSSCGSICDTMLCCSICCHHICLVLFFGFIGFIASFVGLALMDVHKDLYVASDISKFNEVFQFIVDLTKPTEDVTSSVQWNCSSSSSFTLMHMLASAADADASSTSLSSSVRSISSSSSSSSSFSPSSSSSSYASYFFLDSVQYDYTYDAAHNMHIIPHRHQHRGHGLVDSDSTDSSSLSSSSSSFSSFLSSSSPRLLAPLDVVIVGVGKKWKTEREDEKEKEEGAIVWGGKGTGRGREKQHQRRLGLTEEEAVNLCKLKVPDYNDFLPFVKLDGAEIGGYYLADKPTENPLLTKFVNVMNESFTLMLNTIAPDENGTSAIFFKANLNDVTGVVKLNEPFVSYIRDLKKTASSEFDIFLDVTKKIVDRDSSILPMIDGLLSSPFKDMAFAAMVCWGGAIVAVIFYIPAVCILMCGRDAWDRTNAHAEVVPSDSSSNTVKEPPKDPGNGADNGGGGKKTVKVKKKKAKPSVGADGGGADGGADRYMNELNTYNG